MDHTSINSELQSVYRRALPKLVELVRRFEGASCPHLVHVPYTYLNCPTKLFIVGQQTCGWGRPNRFNNLEGVNQLIREYKDFNLGETYARTPFWQACLRIEQMVNPCSPPRSFLWSNLVKINQRFNKHEGRPEGELEEAVSSLNLLQSELRITEPDAVVFFTGPHYDERLRSSFPGIEIAAKPKAEILAKLLHPRLPELSFRTYHPNYLRRSRNWWVLESISTEILCARAATNRRRNEAPPFGIESK